MRLVLLPSVLLLFGFDGRSTPAFREVPVPSILFAFDAADEATWDVVNDGVMGGRSQGFVTVEDGSLRFTGTLVTQGGGFTSVRAPRVIDISGQLGLELRVRGSGRQFEIELNDGMRTTVQSVELGNGARRETLRP